jgi:BirA family biotin operon repressor/biotin-[acetyl-CoA-carboxylase] ligase
LHFNKNQKIGSAYFHFDSIPSTHNYAIELLSNDFPPNGTVISADFQEAGKGQQGKNWFSDSGKNILLSIILYPENLSPSKLFLMNMAVCLAVRKTVLAFYPLPENVHVKWPNDIYIQHKKVAGILTKNSLNFHKVQNTIISVGLNVNQPSFPSYLPAATSLFLNTSIDLDRKTVEKSLFSAIEKYLGFLDLDNSSIEKEYHECLWGINKELKFLVKKNNETLKATILGVSETGGLLLKCSLENKEFHFQHGELIYL